MNAEFHRHMDPLVPNRSYSFSRVSVRIRVRTRASRYLVPQVLCICSTDSSTWTLHLGTIHQGRYSPPTLPHFYKPRNGCSVRLRPSSTCHDSSTVANSNAIQWRSLATSGWTTHHPPYSPRGSNPSTADDNYLLPTRYLLRNGPMLDFERRRLLMRLGRYFVASLNR